MALNSAFWFQLLLTLHLLGLAMGLGGVMVTDFSFMRSLKMGDRITPETVVWMRSFSTIIWIGLGLLGLSGVGLFLFHPAAYLASPGFIAKMIFVAILTINGLFLNFYSTARLTTFNFSEKYQRRGLAWRARKLSFVFGAISATSWYATVFAAMLKSVIHWPLWLYLALYTIALIVAIGSALTLERYLSSRKVKQPSGSLTVDQLAGKTLAEIDFPQPVQPTNLDTPNQTPTEPSVLK